MCAPFPLRIAEPLLWYSGRVRCRTGAPTENRRHGRNPAIRRRSQGRRCTRPRRRLGELERQHGSQVAGMLATSRQAQLLHHGTVHKICSALHWRYNPPRPPTATNCFRTYPASCSAALSGAARYSSCARADMPRNFARSSSGERWFPPTRGASRENPNFVEVEPGLMTSTRLVPATVGHAILWRAVLFVRHKKPLKPERVYAVSARVEVHAVTPIQRKARRLQGLPSRFSSCAR